MEVGFWFNINAVCFEQLANPGIRPRMEAEDWNRVLLEAVFSADRGSGSVRIIRATDSFLAAAVSEPASTGSAIRKQFVDSLRCARRSARNFFDFDVQMRRWEAAPGPPPFFAQLYFSLLVASATEATHDEGDFRRRFCSMLGLPRGDYVDRGLAELWRELELWTKKESLSGRPVRALALPDPGHETIIGYSKRLAFPGFSDFGRLARVLHDADLTCDSPLHAILKCVGGRLQSFSVQFKDEYLRLRDIADRSPRSVYMEPLWAAIEAASFEPAQTARRSRSRFAMDLSIDHFGSVNAHLFTDKHPAQSAGQDWRVLPASAAREGPAFTLVPANDSSVLESILSGKRSARLLSRSPIGKLIEQGCLVFAPSDDSPWSWRPSLPMAGPVTILCRDEALALLKRVLSGSDSRSMRLLESPDWTLVETHDCGPIARSRSPLDGFDAFDSLRPGVTRQQLIFIRPIRLPDGILINRACRADVLAIDCDRVSLSNADESQKCNYPRELEPSGEPYMFRLPAEPHSDVRPPARLVFTGWNGSNVFASGTVVALPSVIDLPLTDDFDAASCLIESPLGQLVGSGTPWVESEADPSSIDIAPTISDVSSSHINELEESEDLLARWDDVEEALYGAFLNANSLSEERITELTHIVIPPWLQNARVGSTLLWHGSRIVRRWARRWFGSSYFPLIPHLRLSPQTSRLDLAGITCRRLRDRFASLDPRATRSNQVEGIGPAPTWHVNSIEAREARDLAERIGLPLRVVETPILASVADILRKRTPRYRIDLATQEVLFWNSTTRRFSDIRNRSKPIELHMSALQQGQRIYSLLRSGRLLWATESRAWALLIHRVVAGEPAFSRAADRIVAKQSLPSVFADAAASGGGVAVRTTGNGLEWVYRFADPSILDEFLSAWTTRPLPDRRALVRWASASAKSRGAHFGRAMVRRYGSSALDESMSAEPK
jgi:hypothetical protein